ncbi:hypothetical protein ACWEQ8_13370 [Streptomyces noursei]
MTTLTGADPTLIRAACLFGPLLATGAALLHRPPDRRTLGAVILATAWNTVWLPALNLLAVNRACPVAGRAGRLPGNCLPPRRGSESWRCESSSSAAAAPHCPTTRHATGITKPFADADADADADAEAARAAEPPDSNETGTHAGMKSSAW